MTEIEKATITGKINKNIRSLFYERLIQKYGTFRGKVSETLEEAIKLWLKANPKSKFKSLTEFNEKYD